MKVYCTVRECEHWENAECKAEQLMLSDHEVFFGHGRMGHFWLCNQCRRKVDDWIDMIKQGIVEMAANAEGDDD